MLSISVILVSGIYLVAGYIVPPTHYANFSKPGSIRPANNATNPFEMEFVVVTEKTRHRGNENSLQNTININESELYEDLPPKTNNVNERSLLYLNKARYAKYIPLRDPHKLKERKFLFTINSGYNRHSSGKFYTSNTGQVKIDDFPNRQNIVNTKTRPIQKHNHLKSEDEHSTHPLISSNRHTVFCKNSSRIINSGSKFNKAGYSNGCQGQSSKYLKAENKEQVLKIVPKVIKENFRPKANLQNNFLDFILGVLAK